MRTTQAWLTLVVAAALAAGLLAFLAATPDQSGRVATSDLGFASLQRGVVFSRLGHAAEHHRAAHAALLGGRDAAIAARSWTTTRAAGERVVASTVGTRGADAAATRRIAAFVRWADGVPARAWRVRASTPEALADREFAWTVDLRVEVTVTQSLTTIRRQVVPVQLELSGSMPDAAGVPQAWRIVDVSVAAGGSWVRAYRDPIVVRAGAIDVVAPTGARAEAQDVARIVAATLRPTVTRYVGPDGASGTAAWIVEGPTQARAVTGRPAPEQLRRAATPTAPHAVAWVDDRGDLLVDLVRFRALDPGAREGVLRHQVAHLALLEHADGAPGMLTEGIALVEEHRRGATAPQLPGSSLEQLAGAFSTGTSGVARGLLDPAPIDLDAQLQVSASAATVAWLLEDRGAATIRQVLAKLDAGAGIEPTLRSTVGLAPRGIERLVAGWTRAQLAPNEETPASTDPSEEPAS